MTSNPAKILVVDDEPIMCSLVADTLRSSGQEVLCALDDTLALQLAKRKRPDLVILDIMIPRCQRAQGPRSSWTGSPDCGGSIEACETHGGEQLSL